MDEYDYVDLSSNNRIGSLAQLWAAGCRRLTLKATEGIGYFWPAMPLLARQWHSFGTDARVQYYHWLYGNVSASAQAGFFWSHVQSVFRPGDSLMTDFEDVEPSRAVSDVQMCGVLAGFNTLMGAHGELETYTGDWYLDTHPAAVRYLMDRPVVLADYDHDPPANRHGLRRVVAHQRTDRAVVPGLPDPVDLNRRLVGVAPTGGDAPTPAPPTPAQGDDVKPWFIRASSGRKSIWIVTPAGVRELHPDLTIATQRAQVLAALFGLHFAVSYTLPEGVLEAGSNLLTTLEHS